MWIRLGEQKSNKLVKPLNESEEAVYDIPTNVYKICCRHKNMTVNSTVNVYRNVWIEFLRYISIHPRRKHM